MRRRALLANATTTATAALALGTAGCLTTGGESTEETTTPATTDTATRTDDVEATESTTTADDATVSAGDSVTLDGVDVDLGALSLQSSFVEQIWPEWDCEAPSEGLYAVLPVDTTEEALSLYDDPPLHALADDDPWHDGGPTVAAMNSDDQPERFAIPVPTGSDVTDVAIAIEDDDRTRHYPLRDDLLATLQDPPSLTATPDVPDTTPADTPVTFSVTVENTGNSPGTLAVIATHDNIYDAYWTKTARVNPETTTTVSFAPDAATPGDDGLDVYVDWGLDSITKTVTTEPDDTTTNDDT